MSGRLTIKTVNKEYMHVISHSDSCSGLCVGVVGRMDKKDFMLGVDFATFTGLAPQCSPFSIEDMTDSTTGVTTADDD